MKSIIETVTIPKAEYEDLKSKVEWLMEQFRLAQHRRFGTSSEKSTDGEYNQLTLFDEA